MIHVMEHGTDKTTGLVPRSNDVGNAGLVTRFRAGEIDVFEELVTANQAGLMRLICRLVDSADEAEDVLQEVFVAAFQGLPNFRQESSFTTWITTIAVNKCRTHRRRATRRRWLAAYLRRTATTVSNHTDEDSSDDAEEVRNAIRSLSTKYQEPVVLHYFEQMSMGEVAAVLGLKTNTVEVRISRARRLLQTTLGNRVNGDHS